MNITDIKIRKLLNDGRLRAVISITLDDELAVHDIKVVQGPERLFVAMPSRREENGTFRYCPSHFLRSPSISRSTNSGRI